MLISQTDLGEILDVSDPTIRSWVRKGKLRRAKIQESPRVVFYDPEQVIEDLTNNKLKTSSDAVNGLSAFID